ncbi:hypothetical protein [Cupriavidus necator]|uniref:hypothetical protein n=1 Tax=Cupriavidus necator TaxID=106590 RepID=UPI00339D642C
MTTEIKDGGPAFPTNGPDNGVYGAGLSLRDYFAAKAMPLFIDLVPTEVWNQGQGIGGKVDSALMAAKAAYRMADAMLAAREAACAS